MSSIEIKKVSIVDADVDAIVNAANSGLRAGGGVCGVIFRAAGYDRLQAACAAVAPCPTGSAVITPGFSLKAKYVIHAVGPIWRGGGQGEPQQLRDVYRSALALAAENGCRSVAFPLISAGIYGYPLDLAWETAIRACREYLSEHPTVDLRVTFAVIDDRVLSEGQAALKR